MATAAKWLYLGPYLKVQMDAFAQKNAEHWLQKGMITPAEADDLKSGRASLLEHMVRETFFFSTIRKFKGLDFLSDEEAIRLKEQAYKARLQFKDIVGTSATGLIEALTPGVSIAALAAFLATQEPIALIPVAVSSGAKTAYNLSAFVLFGLLNRRKPDGVKGHWPLIIGLGAIPVIGGLAYPASIFLDNKEAGELYKLKARGAIVSAVGLLPFYGKYNTRLTQGILRLYDAVFYREKSAG